MVVNFFLRSRRKSATLPVKGGERMDDAQLAELMRRDSPDELWDIYDEAGNKTGRVKRRGDPLTRGNRN